MDKQKKPESRPHSRLEEYSMNMKALEDKQRSSDIFFDRTVITNIQLHELNTTLCMIFDLLAMSYNIFLAPHVKEEKPQ